jgi:hypothetical protein
MRAFFTTSFLTSSDLSSIAVSERKREREREICTSTHSCNIELSDEKHAREFPVLRSICRRTLKPHAHGRREREIPSNMKDYRKRKSPHNPLDYPSKAHHHVQFSLCVCVCENSITHCRCCRRISSSISNRILIYLSISLSLSILILRPHAEEPERAIERGREIAVFVLRW